MPDHLHLVAQGVTDAASLPEFMQRAKQRSGYHGKRGSVIPYGRRATTTGCFGRKPTRVPLWRMCSRIRFERGSRLILRTIRISDHSATQSRNFCRSVSTERDLCTFRLKAEATEQDLPPEGGSHGTRVHSEFDSIGRCSAPVGSSPGLRPSSCLRPPLVERCSPSGRRRKRLEQTTLSGR